MAEIQRIEYIIIKFKYIITADYLPKRQVKVNAYYRD